VSNFIKVDIGKRENTPSALAVKRKRHSAYIEDYDSDTEKDTITETTESEIETYLQSETSEDENRVYPVERTTRNSTQGRQERYDKVFPPRDGKNLGKTYEKDKKKDFAPRKVPTKEINHPKAVTPEPTPVKPKPVESRSSKDKQASKVPDIPKPSEGKGWDSEDIIMDDEPTVRKDLEKRATRAYQDNSNTKATTRQRVSELAAKTKPEKILESVLRTPIRLEVGELLGTSKELSGILANAIKPKSVDSKVEAHSVWTKTRGLLIKIAMHCDGQAINAIIDTGSQLNIVNKHIWKTIINRPIDIAKSVSMNDANGGEGKLRGLVSNVPLNCGGVNTQANLFVGDHVPFSLLLGRPWQRGNFVSIDERKDGTWLLFKDPLDLEVRYELLCTPDGNDPNWDFEPSTWITNMGKTSMYCKINEKFKDPDVIMDNSEIENHVTDLCPDVCMEDAENHVIKLSPDAGMEIAESHMQNLCPDARTEISERHVNKLSSDVKSEFAESHTTHQTLNVLQAKHKIPRELLSNSLTYSQSSDEYEIANNIKEASKYTLRLAPTGFVSEKNSARQPQFNKTSEFGNSDTSFSFRTMPEEAFNETRADVADFLVQNPGNFRFTTTIHNDSLTLAFEPSLPPLHSYHVETVSSVPSPPYTPLQWEQWDAHSEDSIVAPATGYVSAFDSNSSAIQLDPGPPSIPPLPGPLVNGHPAPGDGLAGEPFYLYNASQSLHLVPSTSDIQDGTIAVNHAPSLTRPGVLSVDADVLASETLVPPITSIQDNGHLSNASMPNALSSDASIEVNARLSIALLSDASLEDNTRSSNVTTLLRHETMLSMNDNIDPSINDSHSCEDDDATRSLDTPSYSADDYANSSALVYSNATSIASTPEPGQQNGTVHPLLTAHPKAPDITDTQAHQLSNSRAPLVDHVQEHHTLHSTPEPNATSTDSKGERDHNIDFTNTLREILKHAGLLDDGPDPASSAFESAGSNEPCDVYFLHHSPVDEPPAYTSSTGSAMSNVYPAVPPNSKATLFDSNEHMPSLVPSRPFVPSPLRPESDMRGSRAIEADVDAHMSSSFDSPPLPTVGTIPYHGPSRYDGKHTISFEGLKQSDAEHYLTTDYAKFDDYHSAYIPNVVQSIESYCLCQDELIANDWNVNLFRDASYPGHVVIPGNTKLPTGGPRSGRTWRARIQELRDHRTHSRHLIHLVETILSTRMLAEASTRAPIIKCDDTLHIQGGLTHKTYAGQYNDVNPFFSESESKRLNTYAAIAEAHSEPRLASKILDALLMPFPDEDTVSALTESRLLEVGSTRDILRFVNDRDLVLGIARTGLVVIATSPFRSEMFEGPFYSKNWLSLPDIEEEDEDGPRPKKFFL
jgi:hypothetical protein